jgi:hypothetical protein
MFLKSKNPVFWKRGCAESDWNQVGFKTENPIFGELKIGELH